MVGDSELCSEGGGAGGVVERTTLVLCVVAIREGQGG